jgi:hypothetical protein
MGKMNEIDLLLNEYEENLNAFGYLDPMVLAIKRELMSYNLEVVKTMVQGIELEFDTLVFNNQTEGRF